ncbi:MAG: MFS transporter [Oscillospiraceae bacterium]|nr:MFS transporter [Oscillospiraceae bacterium]
METVIGKLWNRDFSLVVFGQIISIFGNMILSFALPLYVLDATGSAAQYGLALGLPIISLLLLTPIGGIMADRLRKQRIMFWLDASTTVLILVFMIFNGMMETVVPIILVKLLALNAIQGIYVPAVQASVPALCSTENLTSGNAAVGVVNSLSTTVGLAAAGVLYGRFGLTPILIVSAICFAITSVMDLFIRIPYKKQPPAENVFKLVKGDMTEAVKFTLKEKPILAKFAFVFFLFNMLMTSMMFVGMPVLITQNLGLPMELAGINQSVMMLGGLVGGIAAGALGTRLNISRSLMYLIFGIVLSAPMGVIFLMDTSPTTAFIVMTACAAITAFAMFLSQVAVITFIQSETPSELIGKVLSVVMIMPMLANAIGQLFFGVLFESLAHMPSIIIFATIALTVLVIIRARRIALAINK